MHIDIFNIDKFCENLPEITNHKIFEAGKFSKLGLFSQQIFGPVKSQQCACKINFKGVENSGKCMECGVDITSSEERRKRYAKISLPFPILNPIFYFMLTESKGNKLKFNNLLFGSDVWKFGEYDILRITEEDDDLSPKDVMYGLDGVIKYIIGGLERGFIKSKLRNIIEKNMNNLLINNVIIIPPEFRPVGKRDSNGVTFLDEINSIYSIIINKSNSIKHATVKLSIMDELRRNAFKQIQMNAIKLYDYIFSKLSKKKGLIRSSILGKRVDFSGRAVITPEPTLKLNQCSLPYFMVLEMFKLELVVHLYNRKVIKRSNAGCQLIEDHIRRRDTSLFEVVQEIFAGRKCILNRQPTLHRLSILGFEFLIHLGNSIKTHPLITEPFNADYDGDTIFCNLRLITNLVDKEEMTIHISKLKESGLFEFKSNKQKLNNLINLYKPKSDLYISSINIESGKEENKLITEYSEHFGINMYEVYDPRNRFEKFWSSEDHSLIVYDENDEQIKKITPKELIENPIGKYLIKGKSK